MPGPDDTYQSAGRWWAEASSTPFRKTKGFTHEGGIATPLIAFWPAAIKNPGRIDCETIGHIVDIMPTCVEIAGARYPGRFKGHKITPVEGISLVPAFLGRSITRGPLFWEHQDNAAVRQGKWKLVRANVKNKDWKLGQKDWKQGLPGPWELYDMDADRTELHNLAAEHPEQVEQMVEMWQAWADRVGVVGWNELYRRMLEG